MSITAQADQIALKADLSTPIMLAEKQQTVYLRVGLTGLLLKKQKVAPINVALVIDKSGSMGGEKIRRAKDAAIMAVERLRKNDIISIVTYDHHADVLLPATKATDQGKIIAAINRLRAGGSSALYAGVEKAAKEVCKFFDRKRVNRIVLVSDGLANVGPKAPAELGALGASLGEENIAVTTIGLGLDYNEDLMSQLAKQSDGNHAVAENATDLVSFFNHEFGDIFSVVAQEVNVTIIGVDGVCPIRVFGREAEINDKQVSIKLNQLYAEQEKYVLLELEVPASIANQERVIAGVAVIYRNLGSDVRERLSRMISLSFTNSAQQVEEQTNKEVMIAVVEQQAVEKNEQAVKLRDEGKIQEAQQVLMNNARVLKEEAAKYKSKKLQNLGTSNKIDAENLDEQSWNRQRKFMIREQYRSKTQQNY
jgi:Ca-activated chloride channel family protein